jgi:hypothetical protein
MTSTTNWWIHSNGEMVQLMVDLYTEGYLVMVNGRVLECDSILQVWD